MLIVVPFQEIPILFTALNKETDPEIIKCLCPRSGSGPDVLDQMYYRV